MGTFNLFWMTNAELDFWKRDFTLAFSFHQYRQSRSLTVIYGPNSKFQCFFKNESGYFISLYAGNFVQCKYFSSKCADMEAPLKKQN